MFQRFFSTPHRTFKSKIVYAQKVGKNALMYFVCTSYTSYVEHSKWLHADGQIVLQTVGVPNLIWYNSISIECKERKKIGILKEAIFLHKSTTYLQIVMFSNNIFVVGTSTFNPEYPSDIYVAASVSCESTYSRFIFFID